MDATHNHQHHYQSSLSAAAGVDVATAEPPTLDESTATALIEALAEDDRAAIAANIDAAHEIVTRRSTPGGGRVRKEHEFTACFLNAQDFSAALQELLEESDDTPARGSSSSSAAAPAVAGQDTAHEHPRYLSLPSVDDWSAHNLRVVAIGRQIAAYCRDNNTQMRRLAPPPDVLDSAHVRQMLCSSERLPSCSMGDACQGCCKPGGRVLMRYFSPAEWQHFRITGHAVASMEQRGLCYLCLLALTNVAMSSAMSNAARVESVQPPFCHYVDAPGGYVRSALHFSANSSVSGGVSHLVRRINMDDYVVEEHRKVCAPQVFDPQTNYATVWDWETAEYALSERAELLHNAPALPAKGLIVGSAPMLSCEELIASELLSRSALQVFQTHDGLPSLEQFVASAGLNAAGQYVHLSTPFGCDLPQELRVLSPDAIAAVGEHIRVALCFCSFAEARVRLLHLLSVSGSRAETVLRSVRCMASQFQSWKSVPARLCNRVETVAAVVTHSILFLLLMRMDVIAQQLAETRGGGGGPATAALARKLQEYQDALQPMLAHYEMLANTGQPVNDHSLFVQADPQRIIPYAALHPRPRPVYFSADDLLCAAGRPVCNKVSGVPNPPPLVYCSLDLSSFLSDNNTTSSSFLRDAWAQRAITLAPSLLPAVQWVRERIDRRGLPPLALPESLPGQIYSGEWAQSVNARLRNALDTGAQSCVVWQTLAMRIELLHALIVALNEKDDDEEAGDDDAAAAVGKSSFFEEEVGCALAAYINAMIECDGTVRVCGLADVLLKFAGGGGGGDQQQLRFRNSNNTVEEQIRHYAKQFMAAHIALCAELLSAGRISDVECQPVLDVNLYMDVSTALPLNRALASQLDGAPSLNTPSAAPSFALSALSDAMPSPTVCTNELERCISESRASNANFARLMGQLAYATLGGYYRGSGTHVPKPSRLLELYLAFVWPTDVAAINAALSALATTGSRGDHGVQAVLARQYIAHLIDECCPALRLRLEANYTNIGGWLRTVSVHGDALARSFRGFASPPLCATRGGGGARQSRDAWPAEGRIVARLNMQRAFVARMEEACRAVDRHIAACTSLMRRAPVTHSQVAPPRSTLALLDRYVSVLRCYEPSVECLQHLRVFGVSEQGVAQVQRLHEEAANGALTDSTAERVLEDVAVCSALDYALISLFFRLSALHRRRRVVRLDSDIARRQLRALVELDRCYAPHLHCAVLSSVLCCDRICNFTAQTAPNFSGLLNTRTNLESGEMVCVCKRERHQLLDAPSNVEIRDTLKEARAAIAEYWRVAEHCDAVDDESRRAHAQLVRQKRAEALDKAGTHGSNVQKSAHQLQCGNSLTLVRMLGASVEHHGTQAPSARPSSCTLCPRCGCKTAFAPALIGCCGFTCSLCDAVERKAVLEQHAQEEVCCICSEPQSRALAASRRAGVFPRFTQHEGVDDCSVKGAAIARTLWLCSLCYKPWISNALNGYFTLSEVRHLCAITRETPVRLDELTYSTHDADVLKALAELPNKAVIEQSAIPLYQSSALVAQRSIEVRVTDAPVNATERAQKLVNAKRIAGMRRRADTAARKREKERLQQQQQQ